MKTNFGKLKELKDYEVAQIIRILSLHVTSIMEAQSADELDAADQLEDEFEIITSWLNHPYEENKGFEFYLSGKLAYIRSDYLKQYDYLAGSNCDYTEYFDDTEESDNEDDKSKDLEIYQTTINDFIKEEPANE